MVCRHSYIGTKVLFYAFLLTATTSELEIRKKSPATNPTLDDVPTGRIARAIRQKRWISSAVKLTLGVGSMSACVGVMAANRDCGSLQKTICQLGKETAVLWEELTNASYTARQLEDDNQWLEDRAILSEFYNNKIMAELAEASNTAVAYLKSLAAYREVNPEIPKPPAEFFHLDTNIHSYLVNLDKIGDTQSPDLTYYYYVASLGMEVLPMVAQSVYTTIDKQFWPKQGSFETYVSKGGKTYGVKGTKVFEVDTNQKPVRRASYSKVSGYSSPKRFQAVRTTYSNALALSKTAVGKAINMGVYAAGAVFCALNIHSIVTSIEKAERELREQKESMTKYLADVTESIDSVTKINQEITDYIANQTTNFRLVLDHLSESKSLSHAFKSEQAKLVSLKNTATTNENIVQQQQYVYTFVRNFAITSKNGYTFLRKQNIISSSVKTELSTSTMIEQMEIENILVHSKLEIFQILSDLFPNKETYDGIWLVCVRSRALSSESVVEKILTRSLPHNLANVVGMLAAIQIPLSSIKYVLESQYKVSATEDQILQAVAQDPAFRKSTKFTDYTGTHYDLEKYQKLNCS